MLTESGKVVAVDEASVWVQTVRTSLCGKCAARSGCGQGVMSRAGRQHGLIRAWEGAELSASACRIDDEVAIELPESVVLRGSLLVYLLPLMLGFAGALVGDQYGELAAVAGFLGGLLLGFGGVGFTLARVRRTRYFEPRLAGIVRRDADTIVRV